MPEVVYSNNFSPTLVGYQQTDILDNTLLTGNNFPVGNAFFVPPPPATAVSCNFRDINPKPSKIAVDDPFGVDYSIVNRYIRYGSAKDFFISELEGLYAEFPFSAYASPVGYIFNVLDYSYDSQLKKATFRVPIASFRTFDDTILTQNLSASNSSAENNLLTNPSRYELYFSGGTYPLLSYEGPFDRASGGYSRITVSGDPFELTGSTLVGFHLRPDCNAFNGYYDSLTQFQRYMLGGRGEEREFTLTVPNTADDGTIFYSREAFAIPILDGYNMAIEGIRFASLLERLAQVGEVYDQFRTDLYYRCLIPQSIKELNEDYRDNIRKVLRAFGRVFDEYSKAIDSLSHVYSMNYGDRGDQTPLSLIPELSKVFGLQYFDIIDDVEALIGNECRQTDSAINYTLWKNILINSPYLLSAKGTRKPIEFLFRYMGLDECYYVLDEFIYNFERPIQLREDFRSVNINLEGIPYDPANLEPKALVGNGLHFQADNYFRIYRDFGYSTDFINDNEKSYNTPQPFLMNTKEVVIGIDPYKAIECEVWKMNSLDLSEICEPDCDLVQFEIRSGVNISLIETQPISEVITDFYPINVDASQLSFGEYVAYTLRNLINPRNRKVTTQYPKLRSIFNDYLNDFSTDTCLSGETYSILDAYTYMEAIDSSFMKVVGQFVPATTRRLAFGVITRNTVYGRQKFDYKRGINEGAEYARSLEIYATSQDLALVGKEFIHIPINSATVNAVGGSISLTEEIPDPPLINGFSMDGGEVTIYFEEGGSANTEYYIAERLEQGKCEDVDFELVTTGGLFPPTYQVENEWVQVGVPLDPEANEFADKGRVPSYGYFYRVIAVNGVGQSTSNVIFVGADQISVSGDRGAIIYNAEVYFWEITDYTTTPPPSTFLIESGYLYRASDGLYYPLLSFDTNANRGTISETETGVRGRDIPISLACGDTICPNIANSELSLVSADAELEIV